MKSKKIILIITLSLMAGLSGCSSAKQPVEKELFDSSTTVESSVGSTTETNSSFSYETVDLTPPKEIDKNLKTATEEDGDFNIFKDPSYASAWIGNWGSGPDVQNFKQDELTKEMAIGLKETVPSEFQACYVDGTLATVMAAGTLSEKDKESRIKGSYPVDLTNFATVGEHVVQVVNFGSSGDFEHPELVYRWTYVVTE